MKGPRQGELCSAWVQRVNSPRGQPIPDTVEAWKKHAHLMADLVESQRDEINALKFKLNKAQQRRTT